MKDKHELMDTLREEAEHRKPSAADLFRLMRGRSRKVGAGEQPPPDSMMAVYKNRFTYTFILKDEVASIHFDRTRGEIFIKGHNIRNLELTQEQIEALKHMKEVMTSDEKVQALLPDYEATLDRLLADK